MNFKKIPITSLVISSLIMIFINGCAGSGVKGQIRSFDSDWRFYAGENNGAEKPEFKDSSWLKVDVPHDWSIEGLAHSETKVEEAAELPLVRGEWKFNKGDDTTWKNPDFKDDSWQVVKLPANWEDHSNYTKDSVYGWFRREITIPKNLERKDVFINMGKIDDVDETFFNGVKVGGMGHFLPDYTSAWDVVRHYKIPHEIIHYGSKNIISVRVFDGVGGGGIYNDGTTITEGIFESTSPAGSGGGYINAGTGWYRKEFKLPENVQGKDVFIEFDGVYMNSDVWLNGKHLGNRPYGYSSFQYELTPYLKYGNEKNVIAVRADVKQPCSRWYSGAGIYRHVRLIVKNPIHIAQWSTYVTTPVVIENEATVRVETKVQNQSGSNQQVTLETIIIDDTGLKVANSSSIKKVDANGINVFEQIIKVPKPKLWSLENPRLYHGISLRLL